MAIDEWVGSLAAGRVERSPLGYLHVLVERLYRGEMTIKYANAVAEQREVGLPE